MAAKKRSTRPQDGKAVVSQGSVIKNRKVEQCELHADALVRAIELLDGVDGIMFALMRVSDDGGQMAVCRLALAEADEIIANVEAECRSMAEARPGKAAGVDIEEMRDDDHGKLTAAMFVDFLEKGCTHPEDAADALQSVREILTGDRGPAAAVAFRADIAARMGRNYG